MQEAVASKLRSTTICWDHFQPSLLCLLPLCAARCSTQPSCRARRTCPSSQWVWWWRVPKRMTRGERQAAVAAAGRERQAVVAAVGQHSSTAQQAGQPARQAERPQRRPQTQPTEAWCFCTDWRRGGLRPRLVCTVPSWRGCRRRCWSGHGPSSPPRCVLQGRREGAAVRVPHAAVNAVGPLRGSPGGQGST